MKQRCIKMCHRNKAIIMVVAVVYYGTCYGNIMAVFIYMDDIHLRSMKHFSLDFLRAVYSGKKVE